jgi:hypothetical protein
MAPTPAFPHKEGGNSYTPSPSTGEVGAKRRAGVNR